MNLIACRRCGRSSLFVGPRLYAGAQGASDSAGESKTQGSRKETPAEQLDGETALTPSEGE